MPRSGIHEATILKQALEKAIANGLPSILDENTTDYYITETADDNAREEWEGPIYFQIIFTPAFAKAFWGESLGCSCCHDPINKGPHGCMDEYRPAWEYHLRRMVTMEEPLQYLILFL